MATSNLDPTLRGHAVRYGTPIPYASEWHGTTHILFEPGSLAQSISEGQAVARYCHEVGTEFASMANGTLQIDDDSEFWLSFRILYDDAHADAAACYMDAVARKVIRGASIGFRHKEHERRGDVLHVKRADLVDVSICTKGACDWAYVAMQPMDLSKPWPTPRERTPAPRLNYRSPFPRQAIALGG